MHDGYKYVVKLNGWFMKILIIYEVIKLDKQINFIVDITWSSPIKIYISIGWIILQSKIICLACVLVIKLNYKIK